MIIYNKELTKSAILNGPFPFQSANWPFKMALLDIFFVAGKIPSRNYIENIDFANSVIIIFGVKVIFALVLDFGWNPEMSFVSRVPKNQTNQIDPIQETYRHVFAIAHLSTEVSSRLLNAHSLPILFEMQFAGEAHETFSKSYASRPTIHSSFDLCQLCRTPSTLI